MCIDLSTLYLGMKLDSPLVASACPLTADIVSLQILEQAGVSAAVLPSLFEEQIEHHHSAENPDHAHQTKTTVGSSGRFPDLDTYNTGADDYLQLIKTAKRTLAIPIIASLNGATDAGWVQYAYWMQEAGADAVELNIYVIPTDPVVNARNVEHQYCDLVAAVSEKLSIPLAVKIGPYFSALPNLANELVKAGAEGLTLFNRYLAPDIDLETLTFKPDLKLSSPDELRIALRWIAILRDQVSISLAATGGVHEATDIAKALLVGSDAVMIASSLLQHGPKRIRSMRTGLSDWMSAQKYTSIDQLKGRMSNHNCSNPEGLKRSNYMKTLTTYAKNRN